MSTTKNQPKWWDDYGRYVLAVILIFALLVPILVIANGEDGGEAAVAATTTTTMKAIAVQPDASLAAAVRAILKELKYTDGSYVVGEQQFDVSLPAASSAGSQSFADKPIVSRAELESFLKSASQESELVIGEVIVQTGVTRQAVLDTSNWEGVQFLNDTWWAGNTAFVNGAIAPAGSVRHSQAGDIAWIFIDPDAIRSGIIRAGDIAFMRGPCGNMQKTPPTPTPPAPPSTSTTKPAGTTSTTKPGSTTSTTVPGTTSTTKPGSTTSTTVPGTTSTTQPLTTTTSQPTTTSLKPKGEDFPTPPTTTPPRSTTTTTKPPTTTTTSGTTTTTNIGDSGSGAGTTVPTPTTNPPATNPPTTVPRTATTIEF